MFMDFKIVFVFVNFTLFLVTSFNSVDGRINTLPNGKTSELDKEISYLNKPTLKTIKTEYGDLYDCVDIDKQPSLNHPLLKGHKIQTRPSYASSSKKEPSPISTQPPRKMGLKDECPTGTVPIRRTTKEELLRAKSSFREQLDVSNTRLEFAGVSTVNEKRKRYTGAGGYVSIYNPAADHGQLTASVISIEDGPVDQFSVIRVGWMVNLDLYGDSRTRLYTIWAQGVNGTMHGCYNMYCPGFVQISPKIPLDLVFANISIAGGPQYYVKLTLIQNKPTGDWWLAYSENDSEIEKIGYWPSDLFTNFQEGAEAMRWGGMVMSNTPQSPPMGSGGKDCHFRGLTLWGVTTVRVKASESRCYKVGIQSYKGEYGFWFGGSGGDTQQCH